MDAKLEDILKDVKKNEELIITLEGENIDRASYIAEFLNDKGFEVLPKGGHDNNNYHLVARKRKQ